MRVPDRQVHPSVHHAFLHFFPFDNFIIGNTGCLIKNVDLFGSWYNSFICQGIFPKFCMFAVTWCFFALGKFLNLAVHQQEVTS